jgi:hypothetical protein
MRRSAPPSGVCRMPDRAADDRLTLDCRRTAKGGSLDENEGAGEIYATSRNRTCRRRSAGRWRRPAPRTARATRQAAMVLSTAPTGPPRLPPTARRSGRATAAAAV